MNKEDAANMTARSLYTNIGIVVMFFLLMVGFIAYFAQTEPDMNDGMLEQFSQEFAQSASLAHWQWQADGRPERIMLKHYNSQGVENGRKPILMSLSGWPSVDVSSKGCERLWSQLLNVPDRIDGFRIISDYYELTEGDDKRRVCRYGLTRGAYFDYDIDKGNVIFTN